jgi:ATP-dependent Clp protease ATP-binding subunit ClpC
MFARFTDRAAKTLTLANQEAIRFHHKYVGTEHVLLALMRQENGAGATALRNLGLSLPQVLAEIEQLVKSGPNEDFRGKLPETPRAKQAIKYAGHEARALNQDYVGTGHILLGLLRESDGIAAKVLRSLGLTLEKARQEVLKLHAANVEE